jgi:hypothetical protein
MLLEALLGGFFTSLCHRHKALMCQKIVKITAVVHDALKAVAPRARTVMRTRRGANWPVSPLLNSTTRELEELESHLPPSNRVKID